MATKPPPPQRAKSADDIRPLLELCKLGKLFEVQEWIASGKPINSPPIPVKGRRCKTPLDYAIATGFHSLVRLLLENGAVIEPDGYDSPMNHALEMRRFDLVKLLVAHGFDPKSVSMERVFETWDPEIMEYFIELGADVETGNPFAYAFSIRIRTALRVFKKYRERFASLPEQANIALRNHCKDGNLKWISLMLWIGADPYKPGADDYRQCSGSGYGGPSALAYAALYNHYEVFDLKQLRLNARNPELPQIIDFLCNEQGFDVLKRLLEAGMNPNDQENGGCSVIHSVLNGMTWTYGLHPWERTQDDRNIDGESVRAKMKAIHLLAKHGAKWIPTDDSEIKSIRRSLLKLKPDYAVEFAWIMSKYRSCTASAISSLLGSPSIKRHVAGHQDRLRDVLTRFQSREQSESKPSTLPSVVSHVSSLTHSRGD